MGLTELATDDVLAKLEEMLRSGWAFLIADDQITQAVEMMTEPEEFRMMLIPGWGRRPLIMEIVLVKVEAILGKNYPDLAKIHAVTCEWRGDPENGTRELGVMTVAFEDEEIVTLIQNALGE